jgi:hypothetical protein
MRTERTRNLELGRAIDGRDLGGGGSPAIFLGQVYDGGSMPTSGSNRVYLTYPVELGGAETEGGGGGYTADTTRSVPVVVLGSRIPAVGDVLQAFAAGGRWVAESGGGQAPLSCWPCPIPRHDLTVSWVNPVIGNGSTTLTYAAPGQWNSGCVHGVLYSLTCPGSILQFSITYFLSGPCPSGQSQSCSTAGVPPFSLTLSSYTCSPFSLVYNISDASCPVLGSSGYSQFTVTAP